MLHEGCQKGQQRLLTHWNWYLYQPWQNHCLLWQVNIFWWSQLHDLVSNYPPRTQKPHSYQISYNILSQINQNNWLWMRPSMCLQGFQSATYIADKFSVVVVHDLAIALGQHSLPPFFPPDSNFLMQGCPLEQPTKRGKTSSATQSCTFPKVDTNRALDVVTMVIKLSHNGVFHRMESFRSMGS